MVLLAAAPLIFKKELESQEATEGGKATLSCETSSPDCKVTWRKGSTVLIHGEKYTMEKRATTHTLVIHKLNVEDSGEYTCDTGDKKSTATLSVKGNGTPLNLICLLLSSSFLKFISHSFIPSPVLDHIVYSTFYSYKFQLCSCEVDTLVGMKFELYLSWWCQLLLFCNVVEDITSKLHIKQIMTMTT